MILDFDNLTPWERKTGFSNAEWVSSWILEARVCAKEARVYRRLRMLSMAGHLRGRAAGLMYAARCIKGYYGSARCTHLVGA